MINYAMRWLAWACVMALALPILYLCTAMVGLAEMIGCPLVQLIDRVDRWRENS